MTDNFTCDTLLVHIFKHLCKKGIIMAYKGYTDSIKKASIKYRKSNQKRVSIDWLKEDYENRIEPAIMKSGYKRNTFIKEAVVEKLQRMNILDEEGNLNKP